VLAGRSDDPTALAAIARLSQSNEERARFFIDAFDANPFSLDTIRAYREWLRSGAVAHDDSTSTGAQVRHAIEQIARGDRRAAQATLDALMAKYPNNDALRYLGSLNEAPAAPSFFEGSTTNVVPTSSELRALMQLDLTPEQRVALDRIVLTSVVTFNASTTQGADYKSAPHEASGQTIFESGVIGDVPFKFSEPIAFAGTFGATARLTYRILAVSDGALLLEPVKLEGAR
jgi:hypothetical protein